MLEATGGPREGLESSRSDALTGEGRDMGWSVAAMRLGGGVWGRACARTAHESFGAFLYRNMLAHVCMYVYS